MDVNSENYVEMYQYVTRMHSVCTHICIFISSSPSSVGLLPPLMGKSGSVCEVKQAGQG